MDAYAWLKLVHVAAAIVAVGTNVTYFVWLRQLRQPDEHAAYVLRGVQRLDRLLANPAYVVLPVTGILMVLDGDLGFSTFWIGVAIGLYVVMAAFAGLFFSPSLRRQLALAKDRSSDEVYERAARRTAVTGTVTVALVAVIVYLMVMKPMT